MDSVTKVRHMQIAPVPYAVIVILSMEQTLEILPV